MDNELAWYGDAVGGALGADDSATLPTVVFPEQEGEVAVADGAVGDVRVWLPRRQEQVTLTPVRPGRGRV